MLKAPGGVRRKARKKPARVRRIATRLARTGGFSGIELKFLDSSLINHNIPNGAEASGGEADPLVSLSLNPIVQGDGEDKRDGKQICLKSVYVTGFARQPRYAYSSGVDNDTDIGLCFIALVLDTQTNGAQLNSEQVFVNPSGHLSLSCRPVRNLQYSSRFRVLDSVVLEFKQQFGVWNGADIHLGGNRLPFKLAADLNIPVNYTGTDGTISTIVDNSLHVIAYNDIDTSLTDPIPQLFYNARVRWLG